MVRFRTQWVPHGVEVERQLCNPRVSGSTPGAGNLEKLFIWMKITKTNSNKVIVNGKAYESYSWGPPKLKNELCLLQKKNKTQAHTCCSKLQKFQCMRSPKDFIYESPLSLHFCTRSTLHLRPVQCSVPFQIMHPWLGLFKLKITMFMRLGGSDITALPTTFLHNILLV